VAGRDVLILVFWADIVPQPCRRGITDGVELDGELRPMKHRISVFTATALLVIAAIANSGAQEPGGPQPQVNRKDTRAGTIPRMAECKKEAQTKRFGAQFVKRNRFIKECLAR